MNNLYCQQIIEISEIKQLLKSLSDIQEDKELYAFLVGTQYAYNKIKRDDLILFVKSITQLYQSCQNLDQYIILEQASSQLINDQEQEPLTYLQKIQDTIQNQISFSSSIKEKLEDQEVQVTFNQRGQLSSSNSYIEESEESKEEQKMYDSYKEQNCDICLELIDTQEHYPVECCGQMFHKVCLKMYFNSQVKQRRFPLKCLNQKCFSEISQKDVRKILNDLDFQKFEQFQLKNYIDCLGDQASWCPTPDCQFAFILDDDQTILDCPCCKKIYCLSCKEDDKQFESFVRGKKFKQCSQCRMWVEKSDGCDHMTCRCGNQFCYKCGGPYKQCLCDSNQNNQTQFEQNQNNRIYTKSRFFYDNQQAGQNNNFDQNQSIFDNQIRNQNNFYNNNNIIFRKAQNNLEFQLIPFDQDLLIPQTNNETLIIYNSDKRSNFLDTSIKQDFLDDQELLDQLHLKQNTRNGDSQFQKIKKIQKLVQLAVI
ncbi:hypothetical protein ABPG74_022344 [Tetrahymena malaccensis]